MLVDFVGYSLASCCSCSPSVTLERRGQGHFTRALFFGAAASISREDLGAWHPLLTPRANPRNATVALRRKALATVPRPRARDASRTTRFSEVGRRRLVAREPYLVEAAADRAGRATVSTGEGCGSTIRRDGLWFVRYVQTHCRSTLRRRPVCARKGDVHGRPSQAGGKALEVGIAGLRDGAPWPTTDIVPLSK